MDENRRRQLQERWEEIDRELADLAEGKVCDGDPVQHEQDLLAELDAIEFEFGEDYFENR